MFSRIPALVRVVLRFGVDGRVLVVVRRDCLCGLLLGTGVNSSSSSSSLMFAIALPSSVSSSDDWTSALRRVAARRVGLVEEIDAILRGEEVMERRR